MKTINVLSIDWDYFMNATAGQRSMMFPDGGTELPYKDISSIIWLNYYASSPLLKVGALDSLETFIETVKSGLTPKTQVMIADSHKYIFPFLSSNVSPGETIKLYNVDFHHDIYDNNLTELHAGNWLHFTAKEFSKKSSYTWIKRKDSDLDTIDKSFPLRQVAEEFSELENVEWDYIFLARSGMWSPPHLDPLFAQSFSFLKEKNHTELEIGIFESRYDEEFEKNVDIMKSMLRKAVGREINK